MQSLTLFGSLHLWTLAALAAIGFLLLYPARRWMDNTTQTNWAIGLGAFMIVMEFMDRGYQIIVMDEPLRENLPLHLCGISVFLAAALLFSRKYKLFEILYFWGLVGATQSIFTPDLEPGIPLFLYITYFLSHWMIIVAVLYMVMIYHYRPRWPSLWKALLALNVFAAFVAPVNKWLGTNYLFLCHKPASATLLDVMGPWPWYILSLEVAGLLFFVLFYSPYILIDIQKRRRGA